MPVDRQYRIHPIQTGQYPATGDNDRPVSIPDVIDSLKTSALRLNCIARLLEFYDRPGALDEAVETLESIANFHKETQQPRNYNV